MVGAQLIGFIPFVILLLVFMANWNKIKKKQLDLTAAQVISVIIVYIVTVGVAFLIVQSGVAMIESIMPAGNFVGALIMEGIFAIIITLILSALLSVMTNRITNDSR